MKKFTVYENTYAQKIEHSDFTNHPVAVLFCNEMNKIEIEKFPLQPPTFTVEENGETENPIENVFVLMGNFYCIPIAEDCERLLSIHSNISSAIDAYRNFKHEKNEYYDLNFCFIEAKIIYN